MLFSAVSKGVSGSSLFATEASYFDKKIKIK